MKRHIAHWILILVSIIALTLASCGGGGGDKTTNGTTDTTAPSVPTGLSASAASSNQIDLDWTASTDDIAVTGYKIYRGGTFLKTITGITASDTGLTASTSYCYTVSAFDAAGNESAPCAQACATTGSSGGGDTTAPSVGSTSPVDSATGVPRNAAISATFSEAMDPLTITAATFTLYNGATAITGAVSYSGTTATFTPVVDLDSSTTYTASITTGAKDLAGNPLDADYSWNFTTAKSWGTAEIIDAGDYNAFAPQVAIDANGNALVVWYQDEDPTSSTNYSIFANIYNTTTGSWSTNPAVISDTSADSTIPQVAIDANGNAVVAWQQWDAPGYHIYANLFEAGTGWGTAVRIDANSYDAEPPQLAVDPNGNALAVWQQWDGTNYNIYAVRYDATGGAWSTPEPIDATTYRVETPQVAFDANGNAVAVWRQDDDADTTNLNYSIHANIYNATAGSWGTAVEIDAGANNAAEPQVAVDASGNAIAVWIQDDPATTSLIEYHTFANRYDATGGSWGGAELIDNVNACCATTPQVAFDVNGNAFAVWQQWDSPYSKVYVNRFDAAGGSWEGANAIAGAEQVENSQVAFDADGNAFVVWEQFEGRNSTYANRYDAAAGSWGGAEIIDDAGGGHVRFPQVAADGNGNAIAVWYQADGTYNSVYANRYE